MFLVIGIMILATIAMAARWLSPYPGARTAVEDGEPGRPVAFGSAMAWLAVRTRDTSRLIEAAGLRNVVATNWEKGLGAVYDPEGESSRVFVSPPVDGWTFLVGLALPQPLGNRFVDKTLPLLLSLGREFEDVQYFLSYPELDQFAWARVRDGKVTRAYATGDEGILWNKGRRGPEERNAGLRLFEFRGVRGQRGDAGGEIVLYPTEAQVGHIAGHWSLDPARLTSSGAEPGLGYAAMAPSAWRTERLRTAA